MIRVGTFAMLVAVCGISQTRLVENTGAAGPDRESPDRERLIGAWHLVSIVGPNGEQTTAGVPAGMLIFTRDGHMSVQLMYPKSESVLSNEYVQNGYEASFGSYDLNAATHTVTHHVKGSNTGDRLVGKDLPRAYQFNGRGQLVIRSAHPDEHWSVTWEHY